MAWSSGVRQALSVYLSQQEVQVGRHEQWRSGFSSPVGAAPEVARSSLSGVSSAASEVTNEESLVLFSGHSVSDINLPSTSKEQQLEYEQFFDEPRTKNFLDVSAFRRLLFTLSLLLVSLLLSRRSRYTPSSSLHMVSSVLHTFFARVRSLIVRGDCR
ncbi:unnamed protein product [Heligmosomoides polygyrus]|uniref:Transmembrane protein n=1 Tax=Heligmosomoides polygyrus TaxID=6339 RepID=A0A183G243_HELPZ|nr:unnamed protein product [Heligmosomoides polygyrus]